MPNPKVGTVTMDVASAVKNAKAGQVQYRTDKAGIIHCTIGRASFEVDRLKTNLAALAAQRGAPMGDLPCGRTTMADFKHLIGWHALEARQALYEVGTAAKP
jgi:hypothetical protein